MKWLRGRCEEDGVSEFVFAAAGGRMGAPSAFIPEIVHGKGPQYTWNEDKMLAWFWGDMVAQLDDDSMQELVSGPDGAEGLVQCFLFQHDTYDHKRHHADRQHTSTTGEPQIPAGITLREWSFIFVRSDTSYGSLVPAWGQTKIAYSCGPPGSRRPALSDTGDHGPIPATGPGGTNGKGTFRRYTQTNVQTGQPKRQLRFDASLKWR